MDDDILIYVNSGFSVRYLLRSEVISVLRKSNRKIIVLSNNSDDISFVKDGHRENIVVEQCDIGAYERFRKSRRLLRILEEFRAYVLNGNYDTQTIDDFREIFVYRQGWSVKYGIFPWLFGILWRFASFIAMRSRVIRDLIIKTECAFYTPDTHQYIFDKYSIGLVVVTALSGFKYNEYVAREAIRNQIRVCTIILSWDNTSGMGMAGYFPDSVVSWTENMKTELVELHDIDSNKVHVGGVAHFDRYWDAEKYDKELFAKKIGVNADDNILFYATKSPKRFPWGPQLVERLASAIEEGTIDSSVKLLVRIHPLHYRTEKGVYTFQEVLDQYDAVSDRYDCVVINKPRMASRDIPFDMESDEMLVTKSILKYANVMINMYSTLILEASIFDLPSINVALKDEYRGDDDKTRQDIMIDDRQSHLRRVAKTGGVATIYTYEELYTTISMYLKDRSIHSYGRKLIVENETGPYRGDAGTRIGEYLLQL